MSAVILAVIVIMWAVVLVPMWLRRHDAATESRSVDRFSAAMRVLSRRSSSGSERYVLMPRRESAAASASVHVSGASAPPAPSVARAPRAARPAAPRRKASLAVRRRRVLVVLLAIGFLTMVLAAAGVMGWVLPIVVDLVVVAFMVHLRVQAKRSAALARARRRAAGSADVAGSASPAAAPVTPTAARYAERLAQAAAAPPVVASPVVEAPVVEPAVVEPAAMSAEVAAADDVPVEATGTDDAAAWKPVPVPRPTYTMKPPAPPRYYPPVRPDSDADDVPAAAGGLGDETVAAHAEVRADDEDEGQLDEILTHRWAVND